MTVSHDGRSLTQKERKWSVIEREGLAALFEGIKHYHVYLATTKFTVYTDHLWNGLILFKTLMADNFQVEDLFGKSNVVADAYQEDHILKKVKSPHLLMTIMS